MLLIQIILHVYIQHLSLELVFMILLYGHSGDVVEAMVTVPVIVVWVWIIM